MRFYLEESQDSIQIVMKISKISSDQICCHGNKLLPWYLRNSLTFFSNIYTNLHYLSKATKYQKLNNKKMSFHEMLDALSQLLLNNQYKLYLRPSGGGGRCTCSLVPLEKMALFPKNKILIFYVPCPRKLPVFPVPLIFRPLFPHSREKKLPLFPKTPGRALQFW